jgi:hypothetical protein
VASQQPRESTRVAATETRQPEDRILLGTKIVAAVVMGILFTAWYALYLHPGETDHRFAWTIASHMTALLMGAGYGSAILFYLHVLVGKRWHRVALGFLPTIVFTWLLAAATALHWDKFRHGSGPFLLWVWIYAITPLLVPAVWLWNRPQDPGTLEVADVRLARPLRVALVVVGLVILAAAAVMFAWPTAVIGVWPWTLTPLTARAIAGFIALPGVAWLAMAADGRWSAGRAAVQTVALGTVLLLGAVIKAWAEFDHSNPLTYLYVGGLVSTLIGLAALYGFEERAVARVAAVTRSAAGAGGTEASEEGKI